MKNLIAASALVLLLSGNALAGEGYDRCIDEEKALRVEVADRCSGMSYLFNPSACFTAQKALKGYDGDRCKKIGETEKIVVPPPPFAVPEKKPAPEAEKPRTETQPVAPPQVDEMEQLKAENARLKAEITRLKDEIARFRTCQ